MSAREWGTDWTCERCGDSVPTDSCPCDGVSSREAPELLDVYDLCSEPESRLRQMSQEAA